MGGWTHHGGQAVALPLDNVDTDQLIPARFMSVPRNEGYGDFLLHDLRRDAQGTLRNDLPLNTQPGASVLVAGHNFGSGSSREAAVYALVDAGFQAVIAPSFGDIFVGNAVNNGLLPARIDDAAYEAVLTALGNEACDVTIDLDAQTVVIGGETLTFALEDSWRTKLMNGWDDIDLTRQYSADISQYKDIRHQTVSWAWPAAAD